MGRPHPSARYSLEWHDISGRRRRGTIPEQKAAARVGWIPNSTSDAWRRLRWAPSRLAGYLGLATGAAPPYSDQTQCLLLRLPPEIRLEIWEYVLGGGADVCILRRANKLAHAVLPRDQARLDQAHDNRRRRYLPLWGEFMAERSSLTDNRTAEVNLVTPLLSCKRIHSEMIAMLYKRHFKFELMEGFYRFLLLSPLAGLSAVRSIELDWSGFYYWARFEEDAAAGYPICHNESWADICGAVVGMMTGLRRLTLRVLAFEHPARDDQRYRLMRKIVAPLEALPSHVVFTVVIRDEAFCRSFQDGLRREGYGRVTVNSPSAA
ncbi:uncharacterized protein F4812DRAFT_453873 [Daldinia caldariorum]|uniref:uncharacterized protein n=1 Tax=Daldinia caldariorum TaxID=326644 RepID=UPI0020079B7D|nr:uncharacterized protein F4812DRAFT_453873 [Daldinia caldariorum]KAI1462985.1 hypothetical protein F4812DRAFT_453873 [Daldinia caldariorum]